MLSVICTVSCPCTNPSRKAALPSTVKYVSGILASNYLRVAVTVCEQGVWMIYTPGGQFSATSTINYSLHQWHVLISSEICDENWCCRSLLVTTVRMWLNSVSNSRFGGTALETKAYNIHVHTNGITVCPKKYCGCSDDRLIRGIMSFVALRPTVLQSTFGLDFRVFWDVAPCSHVEVDRRFRGAYCLHHRPIRARKKFRDERAYSLKIIWLKSTPLCQLCVLLQRSKNNTAKFQNFCFHSRWWRQYAPLKRRSTSTWLHGATSHKTLNFILAAVRTWNLTVCSFSWI
jgi:hypothetical protein